MPEEWKTSVVFPIFKGKGNVKGCGEYRGVKLQEHAMKVLERVLENIIRELVTIDDMQIWLYAGKAQLIRCLFLGECKRSFVEKRKSCIQYVFCALGKSI